MKKLLLFVLVFLCFCVSVFSQQSVTPAEIFVGDTVELRYAFQSDVDLFEASDKRLVKNGMIYVDATSPVFEEYEPDWSVNDVCIQRVGMTYTLILHFVPWKIGELSFPELNIMELCGIESESPPVVIQPEIVFVFSLVSRLGATELRGNAGPLLLPGTRYLVWSLIIILVLAMSGLCVLIARFSVVVSKILNFNEMLGYFKNSFLTKRHLNALLSDKQHFSDSDFAYEWQKIVRGYLSYRFGCPFASVTTKNIVHTISAVTGDLLSMEQENAVFSLTSLFIRTDYIRYASDSIDSKQFPREEHAANFQDGERKNIVEITIQGIDTLERQEDSGYGKV